MEADSDLEEYGTNEMYILPGDELKLENKSEEDSRETSYCVSTVCDKIFACYVCSQILPWARVSSRNIRPFLKGQTYICNYCDKKSPDFSHKPKSLLDDRDNESLKAAIIESINNQGINFDTVNQPGIIHPPHGTSMLTSNPGDVPHQNLDDFPASLSAKGSNLFAVNSEERVGELSTLKVGQIHNQFVERKLENEMSQNYTKLQTDAQVINVKVNAEKDLVKKYQNLTEEMLKQRERRYECSLCDKKFKRSAHLQRHLRTHTAEGPIFKCDECDKCYRDSYNLVRHKKWHQKDVIPFDPKPFTCGICEKKFRDNYDLQRHIRIHTGETPFKCYMCDQGFIDNRSMQKHVKQHKGEKLCICPICKKGFIDNRALNRHIRTYNGELHYKCDICDKTFSKKADVLFHMNTHSNKLQFKCEFCKESFRSLSNYEMHRKIHIDQISSIVASTSGLVNGEDGILDPMVNGKECGIKGE